MARDEDDAHTYDDATPQEEPPPSDVGEDESAANRDSLVVPALLVGMLLVGVVLGLLVALTWVNLSDADEPAAVTSGAALTRAEEPREADPWAAPPGAETTRLERCASSAEALESPLEAARPAMDQWEVHVGAMNKLVVGAITLQQARDFWNRTRVGAHHRVDQFRESVAALHREGVDCPAPGLMAPGEPALRSCALRVQGDIGVLRAARTSISTWETHVHHMEMLSKGTLSPERATEMWLSMWQEGVRELDAYHRAEREARRAGECPFAAR